MSEAKITDAEMIELMRNGMSTQFWAQLVSITTENIKVLEAQILDKVSIEEGFEGEALTDAEVDRLRDKRSAMIDLMQLPETIIASLRVEDPEDEEMDPYPQHKKQTDG